MATHICVECRHKFTTKYKWEEDRYKGKFKEIKICTACHNKGMRLAVYGTEDRVCLNCP